MLVPISEGVFIPIHRIERISFFGTFATIKFTDARDVERIENEDAQRLRMHVDGMCRAMTRPAEPQAAPNRRK